MLEKIMDTIEGLIKGLTYFCVITIAAVAALFALYFIGMTAIRLAQLCWQLIFSGDNWSF